jgi:hypothetical protein
MNDYIKMLQQANIKIAELEKKLNVTKDLQTVLDFLLGIGNLEGHYFHDRPEDQGPNWWRAHLSEALKEGKKDEGFHFNDQDFQPEALKEGK